MSFFRLALAAATTSVLASVFFFASRNSVVAAQSAGAEVPPAAAPAHHDYPAPTNLKVLPRNLTGAQVHEIMQTWVGELGGRCVTCHVVDKTKKTPDGKPVIDFANDNKEEKQTARKMFTMVEQINTETIAKIDSSGAPVTCGTCHRGHLGPEPFEPAKPPAQ